MSDERAAAVLRVLEADLPPSTVDIDRAVRAGRRRERTRRGLAAGVLAGVTLLAGAGVVAVLGRGDAPPPARDDSAAAATVPPRACVPTALPGRSGEPRAISPNGRLVAGVTADPAVPLLWTDGGAATTLAVPAGVTATPHAVNDDGVIVGLARKNNRTVPFVIRGGVYSELELPAGTEGAAHHVNARGDVAGNVFRSDGDGKAVLWKASGGVTTLSSTTKWASVYAIGDDGTVYGTLGDGDTAYAWGPDGTGRAMPAVAGSTRGKAMGVAGDYVYGHVGSVEPSGDPNASKTDRTGGGNGGEPRWVRWQLSTGAGVEVNGLSVAGVDANGGVVGDTPKGEGRVPARWRDGTVGELPGLQGAPAGGSVVATSRDGSRLVGYTGGNEANAPVPILWRCS